MKAVTEANWTFQNCFDKNGLFQKFTQAIRAVVQEGGFIPPSVCTPSENARYIIYCFGESQQFEESQQKNGELANDLSYEKHVGGMSSVYTGTNGSLSFTLNNRKGMNPKAEIVYKYNQETDTAISLEHLGAMASILGMPDSFNVELTDDDRDEILLHRYIESGAAKIGG